LCGWLNVPEDPLYNLRIDGFCEVLREPNLDSFLLVLVRSPPGKGDEMNVITEGKLADTFSHLITREPREPDVKKDDAGHPVA
jgi:hypothetical protein